MAKIRRDFDHGDLVEATDGRIDRTIIVQTVGSEAETRWMLAQAAQSPLIGAVVGWVDLTSPDIAKRLARLVASEHGGSLAGIRHQVHDEADPAWLRRDDVHRGLAAVADSGLAYDLLIRPDHLQVALEAARSHPDLTFVVDHLAKPPIRSGSTVGWEADLRRLAALQNVACKLSGLVTEADWTNWSVDDLRPFVEVAIEAFGPDRLMYGSDWPVCLLAASYDRVLETTSLLLGRCTGDERNAILGMTAARLYRLDHAP